MRKINWGVIGLGNISKIFCDSFGTIPNSKLLSISSHNKEKLDFFKNKYSIEEKFIFEDYNDIINCKDVDMIYLALPNSMHYEWLDKILEKNKNVLVEKPATIDFKQINKLSKKLLDKRVFFAEAYMYKFHPQFEFILKLIKQGEIGEIYSMNSKYGNNLLTKKKFFFFQKKKKIKSNNRLFSKELGGGCILDLGCYTSSLTILISSLKKNLNVNNFQIFKKIKEIGKNNVDIHAELEIDFDGKFRSNIFSSFKENLGYKSEIIGDKGLIIIDNTWQSKDNFVILKNKKTKTFDLSSKENVYSRQIEMISQNLIDNISKPQFPITTIKESCSNMKIIDEWRK